MTVSVLEVTDLHYSYLRDGIAAPILRGLTLTINAGEFVAIQGPSGSGKSTLLYLLGLLTEPSKGRIKLFGEDISNLTADEISLKRSQNIGFIFQQFHLLPKTSVLDNVLLPTQYFSQASDWEDAEIKAKKYIDLLGLSGRLENHPNQLSGGQQQRVAICRALMNDPDLILADEPTGNLDSTSASQILEILKNLNNEFKKTVIIITHDDEVARRCDRIIRIKDGQIVDDQNRTGVVSAVDEVASMPSSIRRLEKSLSEEKILSNWDQISRNIDLFLQNIPSALNNLKSHKTRTALTMIGISIGIAAVLSMITLGEFTKKKILSGYSDLGANTLMIYGYRNWDQKATDIVPVSFRSFNWDRDLVPLLKVFPEIHRISPVMTGWDAAVDYAGRSIEQDVQTSGSSEHALYMSRREILYGRNFSSVEIEQKSNVCMIGFEIAERLFTNTYPLGEVIRVTQGESSFGCRVIAVLKKTTSNKEYRKPNLQVFVPYTFFQTTAGDWWSAQIKEVLVQTEVGADVEKVGRGIKAYFEKKYGKSGRFSVDSDSLLLSQMKRFLALFTILLSAIAFVTLAVGGIGITNMMMVSVSERFREIGLRKALGATQLEIRTQFLVESVLVCVVAGFIGIIIGFGCCHLAIWAATRFVNKLEFEWTINYVALFLSIVSIFGVGILSGLFPALKAEKLQVIEALRSE